jgi:hypothetical protein
MEATMEPDASVVSDGSLPARADDGQPSAPAGIAAAAVAKPVGELAGDDRERRATHHEQLGDAPIILNTDDRPAHHARHTSNYDAHAHAQMGVLSPWH